ncbi:serine/threonine-protein kinase pdik1l-B-like [Carassius carassius]|uniref:serine/threonine-protein kinase pdik1l-B-like n=1 Tax=Carassius carassius TaxID=217509 RepID=UPI0028696476|nr:serine/threonine-protein kinase pdik1l-B-like [Carassius carassius]
MDDIYTLQQEVGRGSYGVVFKGRVTETGWWGERGDTVAIKRLPCCNPESIELYLQELWAMRITARNHPNVIALYNCLLQTGPRTLQPLKSGRLPLDLVESALKGRVVDKDTKTQLKNPSRSKRRLMSTEEVPRRCFALWLVMEYCEGGDLSQYILSRPPDAECNYAVVQQLGSAIAFLHRHGIVHRDIKPDNVLVRLTKTGLVMKVADFGLSKMVDNPTDGVQSRLALSSTCGSEFYMAPEVWAGRSYTAQADIFSLGVLFWAVLERITFLEDGTNQEQLGAYVMRGRWLIPLGEALCQNPDLQLIIPMRARRAPPLPPPPNPAMCELLMDMLDCDPDIRPTADQLEKRVQRAMEVH